jgi:peptidyl-prolyl cis-trans isomerase A (cyclophilin A)
MKKISSILVIAWIFAIGCSNSTQTESTSSETPKTSADEVDPAPPAPPKENKFSEEAIYSNYGEGLYALMDITEGNVLVKLEMTLAPLTVANFVALAKGEMPNNHGSIGEPFYDGLKFHRVISVANGDGNDFMIQGGDPMGNGQGGPGYKFRDEFHSSLRHNKSGILSMANSGPGSNGSQFFITIAPTPHLDNVHSIFGHVVEGQDYVKRTLQGDKIRSIKIIGVGETAKNFNAMETFNALKNEVPNS